MVDASALTTSVHEPTKLAWRFFDTEVAALRRLSPSFVRLTLTGSDLDEFADNGFDQRFKLVLPDAHGSFDFLPRQPDWYAAWRLLPDGHKNPIRTYTVRRVRPELREVDVDLVLHGDGGPASRFARHAAAGDRLVVLGPNRLHDGPHGGLEFRPPVGHHGPLLLAGDATAVPAVRSILESLPGDSIGEAVLEVPEAEDFTHVAGPTGVRITWLARRRHGSSGLPAAVDEATSRLGIEPVGDRTPAALPEVDDAEPLWEVPDDGEAGSLYAWIAGESSVVKELRRRLVRDLGVDRRSVAFMGYWREGHAEL
jgi:iron complex transport system ATP-binding protein